MDYQDDNDLLAYLETAKTKLHEHYASEYATKVLTPRPSGTPTAPHAGSSSAVPTTSSPRKLKIGDRYRRRPVTVVDELDDYFKMPAEDFDTCDPIEWWRGHRSRFPRLYRLACNVLCIPGTYCNFSRLPALMSFFLRICRCC